MNHLNNGKSLFSERIDSFIAHKRALGNRYITEEGEMKRFDRFCAEFYPTESSLTIELVETWTSKRANETPSTQAGRCSMIRQFAIFLAKSGENAYVIPPIQGQTRHSFVPHIFTESELKAIFSAADKIKPGKLSLCAHEVIPMILRLLYGCGLRISEACSLRKSNVNFQEGVLTILNAKNNKCQP
jgi:site-specific recombinase XerD